MRVLEHSMVVYHRGKNQYNQLLGRIKIGASSNAKSYRITLQLGVQMSPKVSGQNNIEGSYF